MVWSAHTTEPHEVDVLFQSSLYLSGGIDVREIGKYQDFNSIFGDS